MAATTDPTAAQQRSEKLKNATRIAHDAAEHSGFMETLLSGEYGIAGVTALTNELIHIYQALEEGAHTLRTNGQLTEILDPRLDGASSRLQQDLAALGAAPQDPLPATAHYCDRIKADSADPAAFLAHHYTRYLGDLSGGQIIRTMLHRNLGVAMSSLSFYDFSELGKLKPYKDDYREAVNNLPFSKDDDERLCAAAVDSFGHNLAIFGELSQAVSDAA